MPKWNLSKLFGRFVVNQAGRLEEDLRVIPNEIVVRSFVTASFGLRPIIRPVLKSLHRQGERHRRTDFNFKLAHDSRLAVVLPERSEG